jgi:hypothetical protein
MALGGGGGDGATVSHGGYVVVCLCVFVWVDGRLAAAVPVSQKERVVAGQSHGRSTASGDPATRLASPQLTSTRFCERKQRK